MEVCVRCKLKSADFKCEECQCLFCSECDTFIHSIPSKVNHDRIFISDNIKELPNNNQYNFNSKNNFNNDSNNQINSMNISNINKLPEYYSSGFNTQRLINDINENNDCEKDDLRKKIHELNQELNTTKKVYEERINYLHQHLNDVNIINKNNIEKIKLEYKTQINNIINDKDSQIQFLIEEINKHKEINSDLNQKYTELEIKYNEAEEKYLNEINNLNNDLKALYNEKESIDNFYKNKIDEINNINKIDKERIISNYEIAISKLNENYSGSKDKYIKVIQDRENNFKEFKELAKKEKDELNSIIDKLKETNLASEKDQNELIKINENLKDAFDKVNSELGQIKDNLKYTNKENKKLNKQNTIMSSQYSEIKKANDQLHGIVYGRFGRK